MGGLYLVMTDGGLDKRERLQLRVQKKKVEDITEQAEKLRKFKRKTGTHFRGVKASYTSHGL